MDEELLQRQVPQALEAEQSVLGSMLIDERCVPDVVGMLQPDDFYLRQNREIYETIYTMFNFSEKIDPVTVLNKMKERGVYDEQRSYDYIAQLLKITPTAANVKQYCTIVHDKSLLRALATVSSEITEMVYDGVGTAQEMLEVSEKKIYSLRRGNTGDSLQHIGKVMINVYDRLEELAASGSDIPGLSTGLHDLDRKINGLNKTDLILIAARPGMGKTAIALNICLNVAKTYEKTVAFFSLEMSREQLVTRLLSTESFVENQKLTTGLQRLLEIAVLLFPADGSQFVRQLQQLLLNGQGWFCDMLYLVNDLPHGLPRRFGHILVSCILPNIQIFKFCLKDLIGHGRTQFYHICPL